MKGTAEECRAAAHALAPEQHLSEHHYSIPLTTASHSMLTCSAATNLSVGFSLQNGTGYNNMITTGQSALFPQGKLILQQAVALWHS